MESDLSLRRLGLADAVGTEGAEDGLALGPTTGRKGTPQRLPRRRRLRMLRELRPLLNGLMAGLALLAIGATPIDRLPATAYGLPRPAISGFAPVDGIKMWYAIFNPNGGDPVLLLHGGLGSSRDWRNQVPALVGKHKVIVADSRGQGQSTMSGLPIGYELMAQDTLALMDYLHLDKTAIVGWSDGGIIGLDIAIHHPERLTKLFAYGANYNVDGLIEPMLPEIHIPIPVAQPVGPSTRVARQVNRMWNTQPNFLPDELGSIKVPTAIADGEREEAIKPEHTVEMARLIPDARLIVLPGVGHGGLLQDPADFNTAMNGFLDSH